MMRIYNSAWDGGEPLPELDREEIHHLVRVRRARTGEVVEVLNGNGWIGRCTVAEQTGRHLELQLDRSQAVEPHPLQVHLLIALPKGKTFPMLLHKAVELGVTEITPLLSDNTEVEVRREDEKMGRWDAILVEALKQSGNPWKPKLNNVIQLKEALHRETHGARICAALQPGAKPLIEYLGDGALSGGRIEVFVGPEGDFSQEEYTQLAAAGCQFVSLGPTVLKVETAASLIAGVLRVWSLAQSIR